MEQLQAFPVPPVNVVGDEQHRPPRTEESGDHGIEEPLPLVDRRPARSGARVEEFGQQPGQLEQLRPVQPAQVRPDVVRAQPRRDRGVGERAFCWIGPRHGGHRSPVRTPRPELLGEPGLAHAGFAGDQREVGPAVDARAPQRCQLGPLGCTAHQRRSFSPIRSWRGQQRLVGAGGRVRRLDTQFVVEGNHTRVVGAEGARPVPAGVVQAHEQAVGPLMQRVVPQQPFGSGDRRLGITFCGALFGNLGECVEEPLAEPVAFGEQPLVVAAFQ